MDLSWSQFTILNQSRSPVRLAAFKLPVEPLGDGTATIKYRNDIVNPGADFTIQVNAHQIMKVTSAQKTVWQYPSQLVPLATMQAIWQEGLASNQTLAAYYAGPTTGNPQNTTLFSDPGINDPGSFTLSYTCKK